MEARRDSRGERCHCIIIPLCRPTYVYFMTLFQDIRNLQRRTISLCLQDLEMVVIEVRDGKGGFNTSFGNSRVPSVTLHSFAAFSPGNFIESLATLRVSGSTPPASCSKYVILCFIVYCRQRPLLRLVVWLQRRMIGQIAISDQKRQSVLSIVNHAVKYAQPGNHFSFRLFQPLFRNGTATVSSPLLKSKTKPIKLSETN